MADFNIISYVGVGSIRFGMSRNEVRETLGDPLLEFKKGPYSTNTTDEFEGFHVYYREDDDTCEAIEFFEPSVPQFLGQPLLGRRFREVRDFLAQKDENLEIDEVSLTSYLLGVGLYVPDLDESDESMVEGVIAFVRGYYGY